MSSNKSAKASIVAESAIEPEEDGLLAPDDEAVLVPIKLENTLRQEHIADLMVRIKQGDFSARQEMITSNIPLVHHVVRRYRPLSEIYDFAHEDLVSEGVIGLMRAIEKYDSDRAAFSTYAIPWIWNQVQRFVEKKALPMRLPVQLARILPRVMRALQLIEQKKGVSIPLHQGIQHIDDIKAIVNAPREDIARCLIYAPQRQHNSHMPSAEQDAFTEDESLTYHHQNHGDLVEKDDRPDQVLAILEDDETLALIEMWLASLPTPEMRSVIGHTYGVGGLEPLPFQKMTRQLGMSPVQIKAMREEALEILRGVARKHRQSGNMKQED